jgi:hypothetical protein
MVGQTLPAPPKKSRARGRRRVASESSSSGSDSERAEGNDKEAKGNDKDAEDNDEQNSADGDVGDKNDTPEPAPKPTPKPQKRGAGMGRTAPMPLPFSAVLVRNHITGVPKTSRTTPATGPQYDPPATRGRGEMRKDTKRQGTKRTVDEVEEGPSNKRATKGGGGDGPPQKQAKESQVLQVTRKGPPRGQRKERHKCQ